MGTSTWHTLREQCSLAVQSWHLPLMHLLNTSPFHSDPRELSRHISLHSWSRCSSSTPVQYYSHRRLSRQTQHRLRTISQRTSSRCSMSPGLLYLDRKQLQCTTRRWHHCLQTIQHCRKSPSMPDVHRSTARCQVQTRHMSRQHIASKQQRDRPPSHQHTQ